MELGQRDQPCGLLPLGGGEGRAGVLLVEQRLKPGLHARLGGEVVGLPNAGGKMAKAAIGGCQDGHAFAQYRRQGAQDGHVNAAW